MRSNWLRSAFMMCAAVLVVCPVGARSVAKWSLTPEMRIGGAETTCGMLALTTGRSDFSTQATPRTERPPPCRTES